MFILASPCLFCLSVSDHFVQLHRERGEGRNGAGHKWNVTESNWESFKSMAALPRSFLPSFGQLCCRLTWWPQSWSKGDICECRAWKVWLETSEALRFFFSQDGRGHPGQHNPRAFECKCFLYYNGVMSQTSEVKSPETKCFKHT